MAFTQRAARTLARLEADIEAAADAAGVDLEIARTDNVIEIEFDDASKIVINSHEAAGEIWVAARAGGFHFRPGEDDDWVDSRSGNTLRAALERLLSEHAGRPLTLP
ncbi:MAG: iron donor protein CyaY [Lautropia sp.]